MISWLRADSSGTRAYVQARSRAAGGALGPVQSLSSTTGTASSPSFAVAPDGRAAFAWVQTSASGTIVHARARAAGGTLSAVQNLTPVV